MHASSTFSPLLAFEEIRLPIELYTAGLIFLIPMAEKKNHFLPRVIVCFIVGAAISMLFFPVFGDKANPAHPYLIGLWYPFIGLTAVGFSKACFHIGWADAFFIDICAYCTQDIVYVLINELVARFWLPALRDHLFIYIAASAFCCAAIFSIVCTIFAGQLHKTEGRFMDDTAKNIAVYILFYVLMIVMFSFFQGMFNNMQFASHEMTAPFEILICVFILTTLYSTVTTRNAFAESAKLQQFINNSAKYYEMSKEQVEIINRKCHDLKHTLKALEAADEDERKDYIQEAKQNIMFYQQLVHSDNEVINTILAEKSLLCGEKNISLSCSIDSVDLSFIKLTDLYALLGNALDNAIEYVDQNNRAQDRAISLRITRNNTFLSIQVVNPYHGSAIPEGKLPHTSKKNSADHGYGLKSIRYLSKQYGGEMGIYTADGLFTLQIVLPCG